MPLHILRHCALGGIFFTRRCGAEAWQNVHNTVFADQDQVRHYYVYGKCGGEGDEAL